MIGYASKGGQSSNQSERKHKYEYVSAADVLDNRIGRHKRQANRYGQKTEYGQQCPDTFFGKHRTHTPWLRFINRVFKYLHMFHLECVGRNTRTKCLHEHTRCKRA